MTVFRFKLGDRILICPDQKTSFYSIYKGCEGVIDTLERDHYGRIKFIVVNWTHASSLFGAYGPELRKRWDFTSACRHFKSANRCLSCIHRLHHLSGGSCKDKDFKYSKAAVENKLKKIKNTKSQK